MQRSDEVETKRRWGCIVGCVGEVLALTVGFYHGARQAPPGRPDDFNLLGGVEVVVGWVAAFGLGWPVVCLLGFAAWRVLAALDRRANRADDRRANRSEEENT
jgi:hypothetical protein